MRLRKLPNSLLQVSFCRFYGWLYSKSDFQWNGWWQKPTSYMTARAQTPFLHNAMSQKCYFMEWPSLGSLRFQVFTPEWEAVPWSVGFEQKENQIFRESIISVGFWAGRVKRTGRVSGVRAYLGFEVRLALAAHVTSTLFWNTGFRVYSRLWGRGWK